MKRQILLVILGLSLLLSFLPEINAVTFPSQVTWYMPINVINTQASAASANTPIMINVPASNYPYYASNVINAEFFYGNGTVINSWLEGNVANEITAGTFLSSNTLTYWLNIQGAAKFITANTGGANKGVNTIYLGWAGNYLGSAAATSANTLMDGMMTGESPILSTAYASLDTGSNVFSYYCPFGGSLAAVPSSAQCGSWTNSGYTFAGSALYSRISAGTYQTINVIVPASVSAPMSLDMYGYLQVPSTSFDYGLGATVPTSAATAKSNSYMIFDFASGGTANDFYSNGGATALFSPLPTANTVYSMAENSTTSANVMYNYGSKTAVTVSTTKLFTYLYFGGKVSAATSPEIFWVRTRVSPPNGVNPIIALGTVAQATTYTPPTVAICNAVTNTIVDQGQYESCQATITAGTPNYAYTFKVANVQIPGTIANTLLYSAVASTTQNGIWYVDPANEPAGGYNANVFVTDSNPTTVNSIKSGTYQVNPAIVTPTIAVSNTVVDAGNSYESISAYESAGSSPYTYNFLVYNSVTNVLIANQLTSSNTYTFSVPSTWTANNLFYSNVIVTDSATTNEIANSILSSKVTVNSQFLSTLFTASNSIVDQSDWQLLTAQISGGTSTYTYNFLVYNSMVQVANELLVGGTATSNTYLIQTNTMWIPGTYTANVFITDSATGQITVSNTLTFTVDTQLNANPPIPTNPTIDKGQSITLTSQPTGGSGTYTLYQWYTDNNNNCISLSIIGGATSSTYVAAPTSNTYYCYIVTDSALGVATSSAPSNVVVSPVLATPTLIASNTPTQAAPGYELFSAYESGGTLSYTYNFLVYNSITNVIIANQLTSSNTFLWGSISSAYVGNTIYANVFVTDSAYSPVTANSIHTSVITIVSSYTPPNTPTITNPTNSIVDVGQYETFNGFTSGGTLPYTYNFFIVNSFSFNIYHQYSIAYNGITFQVASANDLANSPEEANVVITDGHPTTVNSVYSSTFTVYSALSTPTLTISNTLIDYGQYSLITPTINGGAPNYIENIIISNSFTNLPINSIQVTVASGTAKLFYFPSWYAGNSLQVNVVITDSATTNSISNSIYTALGFNAPPQITYIISSNQIADQGEQELVTGTYSLGTVPYTSNIYVTNALNGNLIANSLTSSSSTIQAFNYVIPSTNDALGTENIKFTISDSATTPNSIISTNTITVYSNPSTILTISPSNSIIYPNSIIANSITSGGTGTFNAMWTINSINAVNTFISTTQTSNALTNPKQGSYTYNVIITDIGTTNPFTTSQVTNTLVVRNQTLLPSLLSFPNFPSTGPASHSYTVTAQINTTNSQLNAILYVNGQPYSTFNNTVQYSTSQAGTYNFTIQTQGNNNYASNSLTQVLVIYPTNNGGNGGGGGNGASSSTTTIPANSINTTNTIPSNIIPINTTGLLTPPKNSSNKIYIPTNLTKKSPTQPELIAKAITCNPFTSISCIGISTDRSNAQIVSPLIFYSFFGSLLLIVALAGIYRKIHKRPAFIFLVFFIVILAFFILIQISIFIPLYAILLLIVALAGIYRKIHKRPAMIFLIIFVVMVIIFIIAQFLP